MTVKVYVEQNAWRSDLRKLVEVGRLESLHFPFDPESFSRRSAIAKPAGAYPEDQNIRPEHLDVYPEDYDPSPKREAIERIIGIQHRRDICHVDSAFASGARFFFTCDRDILRHSVALKVETGISFFDPERDWPAFLGELASLP